MPWWAVSASIIATVVSAVTFVSIPAAVLRRGKSNLRSGRYRPSSGNLVARLQRDRSTKAKILPPVMNTLVLELTHQQALSMALGLLLNTINSGVKLLAMSLVWM